MCRKICQKKFKNMHFFFIEIGKNLWNKSHLIIWFHSCNSQNNKLYVICLYQFLILKSYSCCIDHKLFEVVHTFLNSDRDFERIEEVLPKDNTVVWARQVPKNHFTRKKNSLTFQKSRHSIRYTLTGQQK